MKSIINSLIGYIRGLSGKQKILSVSVLGVVLCGILLLLIFTGDDSSGAAEEITYKEATVETVTMEQSLTAAGEVTASDTEAIAFSTTKTFKGMCVEEEDIVAKGDHLIAYTDGTYKDAPYNGVITAVNAPEADTVGTSSNTITLANTDKLLLEITVPENEVNYVKEGDSADIIINADTSESYTAEVASVQAISTTQISDAGSSNSSQQGMAGGGNNQSTASDPFGSDSSTAYYTVDLLFDNDGTILTGMSANCTITFSSRDNVMAVPVAAVFFEDDEAYVYVKDGNSKTRTEVTIGESDANYVEITEGLDGTETIYVPEY